MVFKEEELRIQHYEQARELSRVSECSTTTVHSAGSAGDYNKASKQCRSLPVLLFTVVNLTSLSAALISLNDPGHSRN